MNRKNKYSNEDIEWENYMKILKENLSQSEREFLRDKYKKYKKKLF